MTTSMKPLGPSAVLAGLIVLCSCETYRSPQDRRPTRPSRAGKTAVQALIGAADFHKLEFERSDPAVPGDTVKADLSTMPAIGIAGQYAIGRPQEQGNHLGWGRRQLHLRVGRPDAAGDLLFEERAQDERSGLFGLVLGRRY